ncbi:putative endoribonuclease L-PSP [Legionella massiliensis]|uniref:Putative endoribonuclease L-PSP n=1 Tax=Legionella massiliensis TaxID=1034943 RepID=A0A078KTP3_9GAMM|nr:RidA family protein [Legionella massiliensis]CDZ76406.1 putative endoribonuclease L-PSP [Legionella massiliensis]CEE12144.1 Enamine/imine deaminase [Legionella massiliensis]
MNNLIFVTGQAGQDKEGRVIADNIEDQTKQAFKNIEYALQTANSGLEQIISMTSYLINIEKNGLTYFATRKKCMPVSSYTSTSVGLQP